MGLEEKEVLGTNVAELASILHKMSSVVVTELRNAVSQRKVRQN